MTPERHQVFPPAGALMFTSTPLAPVVEVVTRALKLLFLALPPQYS